MIFSIILATLFSLGIFSIYTVHAPIASAQEGAQTGYITPQKAQEIAINAAGGGVITKCKQDNKFGLAKYKVTVHNGEMKHDIEINAANGSIIRHNQKMERRPYNNQAQSGAKITSEQAKTTALNMVGSGEIVKSKFTNGKKGAKYDITIISGETKHEIDVNAYNNTVVKYEQKTITQLDIYPTSDMISPERAKAIARSEAGSGIIIKCKLDYKKEYGSPVYDVDVVKDGIKYKYHLNSINGSILKYDIDYNYNVSEMR